MLECDPAPPWSLPQPRLLQQTGFKLGGWIQQGVTLNAHESDDGFNGTVLTNDWDDQYQLNQLWFYLHRPADTSGGGFAWGGHIDMIFGTDGRFGINYGLEDHLNGGDLHQYGLVFPQIYLELAYNKLSVKLGHFAAILDYEVVPGPPNPFYSHSYSYAFTVPQLVTGALADYKLTDGLSLQAGFHRGWMMFEDLNDQLDFMGGIKWQLPNEKTSIAYAISAGPQDPPRNNWDGIPGNQNRFVYSLVFQQQLTERLKYVAVHNLGIEQNGVPGGQDAEWYGINQYLRYTINPCLEANLRAEVLRDDDGAVVAGPGNDPTIYAWAGRGFIGNFVGITGGLNWRPSGNWIIRPEVRWDRFHGRGLFGLPFDGGNRREQVTGAIDAILTY
jgi:hypothetical protein